MKNLLFCITCLLCAVHFLQATVSPESLPAEVAIPELHKTDNSINICGDNEQNRHFLSVSNVWKLKIEFLWYLKGDL